MYKRERDREEREPGNRGWESVYTKPDISSSSLPE